MPTSFYASLVLNFNELDCITTTWLCGIKMLNKYLLKLYVFKLLQISPFKEADHIL